MVSKPLAGKHMGGEGALRSTFVAHLMSVAMMGVWTEHTLICGKVRQETTNGPMRRMETGQHLFSLIKHI